MLQLFFQKIAMKVLLVLILAAIKRRIEFLSQKRIDVRALDKTVYNEFDLLDAFSLLSDEKDVSNFLKYCSNIIERTLSIDNIEFFIYDPFAEEALPTFD